MMDLVGNCTVCGKPLYCKGGFFDGITDQGKLYCGACFEEHTSEAPKQQQHSTDPS